MRVIAVYGLGLCLVSAGSVAVAQSSLGPERADLGRLRGDVWATWTAPAHIDHRSIAPLAAATALIAAIVPRDSAIHAWMTTHPHVFALEVIGPLREGRTIPLDAPGSGQYVLPASAVAYTGGRLSHNASLRDGGLGCAASHLSSAGLRELIYFSVSRIRPSDTANALAIGVPGQRAWSHHSFLSGHVANSMSCASFLAHRYHVGLAAPVLYAWSAAIGVGRMVDSHHWASDTMAGGILGYAIGKYIADRQLARLSTTAAAVAPTSGASASTRRFSASWRIQF